MVWVILVVAGLLETGWAAGLKASEGFTKFWPSVVTIIALTASMLLLGYCMRTLPLGTAYAIWTGIGAIGGVIVGIAFFGEAADAPRLICLALIVAGILGLKWFSPE